jgi:branched-chain amino acid transport system ATP-binding protein
VSTSPPSPASTSLTPPVVLEATGVDVHYEGIHAVKGVSIAVRKGGITTLIGANGAGKTTTLKAICGLLTPSGGRIVFEGQDIAGTPAHLNVRRGLILCPEGRHIFPEMTVDENLDLGAYLRHDKKAVAEDVRKMRIMFPILGERSGQMAGTLSGGEQQMLAIARALMAEPKLLMLDEPSLGLAPILVEQIFTVLHKLKSEHVTILLVEQNARQALELADYAYVLETGKIVKEGPAQSLISDPHVVEAYLGG